MTSITRFFFFSWTPFPCLLHLSCRLDKTKFYVVGAGIFTGITVALYPMSVVKTRLQVASKDAAERNAYSVIRGLLKTEGIPGLYRGFGTVITGAVPTRIIFLTALETTKVATFKMVEPFKMSDPSKAAIANGIAGMLASLCSQAIFVPIDVVCSCSQWEVFIFSLYVVVLLVYRRTTSLRLKF